MIGAFLRRIFKKADPLPEPEPWWVAVFKIHPIGSEFDYRGRKLLVVEHVSYRKGLYGIAISMPPQFPELHCHYADDRGRIHRLVFDIDGLRLLKLLKERT